LPIFTPLGAAAAVILNPISPPEGSTSVFSATIIFLSFISTTETIIAENANLLDSLVRAALRRKSQKRTGRKQEAGEP
jgi:hypothetical protein